jgi:hypothetical protein
MKNVADAFTNVASLLQKVAEEANTGSATTQAVKDATRNATTGLKDVCDAIIGTLDTPSATTPQSVAQAVRTKANDYTTDPNQAVANWLAAIAKAEGDKNGASIQSVKNAVKQSSDNIKSKADFLITIINAVPDTQPRAEVGTALKTEADKPATIAGKTAANLIVAATNAVTSTQADVYKVAKDAANNLQTTVDAVVSAIDTASSPTPQFVAQAARTEANKSTTDPAQPVASQVASAVETEAGKAGATVATVQKVADDLKKVVDAIVDAVDAEAGKATATVDTVKGAARTEADKSTTDPAKTVANQVASAVETEAGKAGATVATVQKVADDLKKVVDAIASAVDATAAPTPTFVAQAAQTEAAKYTTDPAKSAADFVAKAANTEASGAGSVKEIAKQVADNMKLAADMVASVTMLPWLPLSGTTGFFIAHSAPDGTWMLNDKRLDGPAIQLGDDPNAVEIRPITVLVEISRPIRNAQGQISYGTPETLGEYNVHPLSPTGLTRTFTQKPATRLEDLTTPFAIKTGMSSDPAILKDQDVLQFAQELLSITFDGLNTNRFVTDALRVTYPLGESNDGKMPDRTAYEGDPDFKDTSGDQKQMQQNGLLAFESVEDISIVAAPGYSIPYATQEDRDRVLDIHKALITHCEKMRYRVAVLDTPKDQLVSGALDFRNLTSSKYAALYYPWITILDPVTDQRLNLPPSGFVSGIYARNDTEHGVSKAPANEVVRLAIDFEQRLNKAQQDVLNPEGVNCFRFFPGRGFLLWGARTISDDPEWKYISVRRYFAYLEHSIDRGTQWVVFENNNRQLWDNVRRTVEDFLLNEWKMGALMGDKPEQAYFVRCDLSTMTQNDLDNGRLVCLIGVAVVKPAEFVIFRIGQWTATTNR